MAAVVVALRSEGRVCTRGGASCKLCLLINWNISNWHVDAWAQFSFVLITPTVSFDCAFCAQQVFGQSCSRDGARGIGVSAGKHSTKSLLQLQRRLHFVASWRRWDATRKTTWAIREESLRQQQPAMTTFVTGLRGHGTFSAVIACVLLNSKRNGTEWRAASFKVRPKSNYQTAGQPGSRRN